MYVARLDRIVLSVVWLHNLKHQTDLVIDVPNTATTTTSLTESARRTNILFVELDGPPILHILYASFITTQAYELKESIMSTYRLVFSLKTNQYRTKLQVWDQLSNIGPKAWTPLILHPCVKAAVISALLVIKTTSALILSTRVNVSLTISGRPCRCVSHNTTLGLETSFSLHSSPYVSFILLAIQKSLKQ